MKEAIILAGGFGSRLRSIVSDVPKPMSPVGGTPFLELLLGQLSLFGPVRAILSVGYKKEIIINRIGRSFAGMPICYSSEDTPLGTGGAVARALLQTTSEDVLVMNGDSMLTAPIDRFFDFHRKTGAPISVALKAEKDFDRYGTVSLDGDKIVGFSEKKHVSEGVFNAGWYMLRVAAVKDYLLSMPAPFSLERDVFEKGIFPMSGLVFHDYFIDVGVPEDYARAQTELPAAFRKYAERYARP